MKKIKYGSKIKLTQAEIKLNKRKTRTSKA